MIVKICAAQTSISKNKNANLSNAEKYFIKANKSGCKIICFPEIFLTGNFNLRDYDEDFIKKAKQKFSEYCRMYKIHAIMGSIIEKRNGNFYNTSYLFDDKGKILGKYDKIHLVKKSESKKLHRGNSPKVFKTRLGNIGIQICRDLLYPEITRELMLKGVGIIFCPSYWCEYSTTYPKIYAEKYSDKIKPREVDFIVSSRAIEAECCFVYVNAAGVIKEGKKHDILLGRTQIAVPFYGCVARIEDNSERVLIYELNTDILKDAKKVYCINEGK